MILQGYCIQHNNFIHKVFSKVFELQMLSDYRAALHIL